MNDFVNPKKRSVLLSGGCKDLMDVLRLSRQREDVACSTSVIRPEIRVGGLEHVDDFVARLSASAAHSSVLAIASLDSDMLAVLHRSSIGLTIYPVMGLAEVENDVEDFFTAHGIRPTIQVGQPGMPRVLGFPLPSDLCQAARITIDLLCSVFGLDLEAEMEFTFLETAPPE